MSEADGSLLRCGINFPKLEGWGYFNDSESRGPTASWRLSGNGHEVFEKNEIKQDEDGDCEYRLTFVKNSQDKGFVIHYRPSVETSIPLEHHHSVYKFLGLHEYHACPEFDLEPCFYRTIRTGDVETHDALDYDFDIIQRIHGGFDAHKTHFSEAIKLLISVNDDLSKFGVSFLQVAPSSAKSGSISRIKKGPVELSKQAISTKIGPPWKYDVALSFAGTERKYASMLHDILVKQDISVFYDKQFESQLWGSNLASKFDIVFSKEARFCVVFVSKEYRDRIWTRHEFASIMGRTIKNRGREYILPIQIDDTELDGLPSTIGYLKIEDGIEHISNVLIEKLNSEDEGQ